LRREEEDVAFEPEEMPDSDDDGEAHVTYAAAAGLVTSAVARARGCMEGEGPLPWSPPSPFTPFTRILFVLIARMF